MKTIENLSYVISHLRSTFWLETDLSDNVADLCITVLKNVLILFSNEIILHPLVIHSSPYSIWGNLYNRTIILLDLCKEIIKVDYFKCMLILIAVQKRKWLPLTLQQTDKVSFKRKQTCYCQTKAQCTQAYTICLISPASCSIIYYWSDSLAERVKGRKRQSSRNPSQDESSNLVLRAIILISLNWKK